MARYDIQREDTIPTQERGLVKPFTEPNALARHPLDTWRTRLCCFSQLPVVFHHEIWPQKDGNASWGLGGTLLWVSQFRSSKLSTWAHGCSPPQTQSAIHQERLSQPAFSPMYFIFLFVWCIFFFMWTVSVSLRTSNDVLSTFEMPEKDTKYFTLSMSTCLFSPEMLTVDQGLSQSFWQTWTQNDPLPQP